MLLLTGAGRGFCAGQDLSDRAVAPGEAPVDLGESIENNYRPLVLGLRDLPLPVVCAVNGVAAGAGANIALACDIVIAAQLGELHPGVLQDRAHPRFGRHLFPAAACRHRARDGTRHARRQAERGAGRAVGTHLEVRRRRGARIDGRCIARAAGAGAHARSRGDQARAPCARRTPRSRMRSTLERDLQRELGYSDDYREGVAAFLEQAATQVHAENEFVGTAPRRLPSSAPARWAPASRRWPRKYGHRVHLFDNRIGAADAAQQQIGDALRKLASKGKLDSSDAEAAAARIVPVHALGDLVSAKLVVEAIVEDLDVKRKMFRELEVVVTPDAMLASNTSSFSITSLAAGMKHPGRIVGMHFFNPAPILPLVEVVSGLATERAVADLVYETAKAWGKVPVHAKSTPGFIVNRCARPFYGEALRLLLENAADAATIDAVMREAGGFRMGPFELMDLIGLDVNFAVTKSVWEAYFHDPRFAPSILQARAGRRRTARPQVRPRLLRLCGRCAASHRPRPRAQSRGPRRSRPSAMDRSWTDCASASRPRVSPSSAGKQAVPRTSSWKAGSSRRATGAPPSSIARDAVVVRSRLRLRHVHEACGRVGRGLQRCGIRRGRRRAAGRRHRGVAHRRCRRASSSCARSRCSPTRRPTPSTRTSRARGTSTLRCATASTIPCGPLAWADAIGVDHVRTVLRNLAAHYGDPRYRTSPLVMRAERLTDE